MATSLKEFLEAKDRGQSVESTEKTPSAASSQKTATSSPTSLADLLSARDKGIALPSQTKSTSGNPNLTYSGPEMSLDYINSYLNDYNDFVKRTNTAYDKMNYQNSKLYLQERQKALDELMGRRSNIVSYMAAYGNGLNVSDYKSLQDAMKETGVGLTSMGEGFKGTGEFYGSFESEKEFDEFQKYSAELERQTALDNKYLPKYEGMSYTDKLAAAGQMDSRSEEYQWLKDYAEGSMTLDEHESQIAYLEQLTKYLKSNNTVDSYATAHDEQLNQHYIYEDEIANAKARLEKLNAGKWKLENEAKYNAIPTKADFKTNSVVAGGNENDGQYQYINDIDNYRISYDTQMYGSQNTFARYKLMTDEQKGTYNYLYNTEGKAAADEYLEYIGYELNAKEMAQKKAEAEQYASEHPFWASVDSVGNTMLSGLGLIDASGQKLWNDIVKGVTGEYAKPVDYNRGAMRASVVGTTERGTIAQNLKDTYGEIQISEEDHPILARVLNGKNWGEAYQLGMSMVDSLAVAQLYSIMGPAATALLGGSAGTQGMLDAIERGATDEQAIAMGIFNGAFEMIFEKVSIENLLNLDTRSILKAVLMQGLAEGSEEFNTSLFNSIADIIVMAEKSNYEQNIANYLRDNPGMSREEAATEAFKDACIQIGWDFVGGAIMGGVMGGSRASIDNALDWMSGTSTRAIEKQIKDAERYAAAHKYIDEQYAGDISLLAAEVQKNDPENALAKKVSQKSADGGYVKGKKIEKLIKQNEQAKIRNLAESKLKELGETNDVAATAKAISKYMAMEKLSEVESGLIKQPQARKVIREIEQSTLRTEASPRTAANKAVQTTASGASTSTVAKTETVQKAVAAADSTRTGTKTVPSSVETVASKYGKQAGAVRSIYNISPVENVDSFAKAFETAYTIGLEGGYEAAAVDSSSTQALSITQRRLAYATGKAVRDAKKLSSEMRSRPGSGVVRAKGMKASDINKRFKSGSNQKTALQVLRTIAEATGFTVEVFDSSGDYSMEQGSFDWSDDVIRIDIASGICKAEDVEQLAKYAMLRTFSHEFTHTGEKWAAEEYNILRTAVLEALSANEDFDLDYRIAEIQRMDYEARKAQHIKDGKGEEEATELAKKEKLDWDMASREVVAEAMTDVLPESNFIRSLYEKSPSLAKRLGEALRRFLARVKVYYNGLVSNPSIEAQALKVEIGGTVKYLEGIVEKWDAMAVAAVENYQNAELIPGEEGTITNKDGEPVAHSTKDGTVQLSLRTYEEDGRTALRNYLEKCVSSNRLTKAEMQEMLDGIEDIYNVCKEFKDKYAPFSSWSDAEVVKDTYGKPVFSVVTPNGDYKMNLDFSLVCKKRRTLDAVFNEMSKRGIIDNFELGQKSVVKINEIIRKHGFETACALCFVDAKRFRQASMADQFVTLYNELVESLVPAEQYDNINKFNFAGYSNKKPVENSIDKWPDSELDFSHLDHVMATYGKGTVEYKAAKYIKNNPKGRKLLLRGDFMSSQGFDAVKTQNQSILKLYNSKKGTGGPKAAFGDVQYMNEVIKKAKSWTPAKAYAVGGVRIQSFSDYVPRMVFDYVQMIYDLAATKLPAHAYTKEALFVKQFGLTGVKINMSLIPAIDKNGIAAGLDANGNYVWAGESFDFETAKQIQNAKGYSENCGTICVGVSKQHINKLLSDPDIRMVIPYHKSGLNPIVAHMNKIAAFTDYTNSQRTRGADGKVIDKDFDFNKALHDMGKEGNPKAVAKQYLDWCAANGYTPKFEEFAWHENYYKLLEDFTVYDKDGKYVPQREVRAVFPKAENAFGAMKELIQEGLQEDAIIQGKRDSNLSSIVDEIEKSLPKTEAEIEEAEVEQADRDVEAAALTEQKTESRVQKQQRATMTAARIDDLIEDSGAGSRTDYAQKWITSINPTDFLNMTLGRANQDRAKFDTMPGDYDTTVNDYDFIEGGLKKSRQTPYLAIDMNTGEVVGHEGRHRMRALEKEGITSAEIVIELRDEDGRIIKELNGYGKALEAIESLTIYNQRGTGQSAVIQNIIPLNKANRDNVLKSYGPAKPGAIQYSRRTLNDQTYMDAVKQGDMETAQRMVDEAAKAAGYTAKVYHGTQKFGFTKIDTSKSDDGISFFATEDLGVAGSYAQQIASDARGINEKKEVLSKKSVPKLRNQLKVIGLEYLHEYSQALGYYDEWYMNPLEYVTENDFSAVVSPSELIDFATTAVDTIASVHANIMDAIDNPTSKRRQLPSVSEETRQKLSELTNEYAQKAHATISPYQDVGVYALYANTDNHLVIDAQGSKWNDIKSNDLPAKNGAWTTRDVAQYAKKNGYSGVTFKNIIDPANNTVRYPATVYAFFDPQSQVKSSDPVTYNKLGRVIPLSERFNTKNADIRYQRRTPSYTDREVLEIAAEDMSNLKLTDGERGALDIFSKRLDNLKSLEQQRDEQRQILADMNSAAKPDADEIRKTKNRLGVLGRKIKAAEADVLSLEDKKVLKKVLHTARRVVETEQRNVTRENRNTTAMRHKVRDIVNELNNYLLKGSKDKHVMIGLQKAVASALDVVNMDTVGAEERIAKLEAELMKAKTPEKIQEISRKIDRVRAQGDKMSEKLANLKAAYAEIKGSSDPLIANAVDEVLEAKTEEIADLVGNTPLRDMSLKQLEGVYELYKMVLTRIREANTAFKASRSQTIEELATNARNEVEAVGGNKKVGLKSFKGVNDFFWNNLKPVYAFKAIGSKTLGKLFDVVRAGEDTWATDVTEARKFFREQAKRFKYDKWDMDETIGTFKSISGLSFKLNLGQAMSLYAYSKRDQAESHLQYGGVVLEGGYEVVKVGGKVEVKFKSDDATAYNISPETMAEIVKKLGKDRTDFVDAMQDYLSTTMGAKGNEVSLALYGIKLFKEAHYFPLRSSTDYQARARAKAENKVKIKNSGFTKETKPEAKNPIVLESFMDVWESHVNDMSMYHAFTLPLEDFYRVYDLATPNADPTKPAKSLVASIRTAYGQSAVNYIDRLLSDLNGGARSDPAAAPINALVGKFKKGAVFASASVVVQQLSSVVRAMALIDSKYFVGKKMDSHRHKALWEEIKQYAPIAMIKEMGYFDTNMGKSTADFIKAKEYNDLGEKAKAFIVDSNYRDELFSWAPAKADELAWCMIWEAVKRETIDKHPALKSTSDEFLQLAGARFTEVIVNTQVYDSVLSRSTNMRSTDTGLKSVTAFMAEPTTAINMISDALIQAKRGNKKQAAKTVGAVIAAQILNSILASFVYAARDDDEDKTYWEKYLKRLADEVKFGFNPGKYLPFIKDIISIVQGYDVERSDMSVISDIWKSYEQLHSDKISGWRKVENFVGGIATLFGLPVKNIMRDARALYQTVDMAINGENATAAGARYALAEGLTGETTSNGQQLYEAMLKGDKAHADRVTGRFEDQAAADAAIRKALRDNDPRIHEAAVARHDGNIAEYTRIAKEIIGEGHFKQDHVVMAIMNEMNSLDTEEAKSESKATPFYTDNDYYKAIVAGDSKTAAAVKEGLIQQDVAKGELESKAENSVETSFVTNVKNAFLDGEMGESAAKNHLVAFGGKDEEEASTKLEEWKFEREYGYSWNNYDNAYRLGAISKEQLIQAMMKVKGKDEMAATYEVEYLDIQLNHPEYNLEKSTYLGYHSTIDEIGQSLAEAEVPLDVWLDYEAKTVDMKKAEKLRVINSLPLTDAQKDAIYFKEGWARSTLGSADWRQN